MKRLTAILITALLTGCTTTASQPYNTTDGETWNINGQYNEVDGGLVISINGETVIDDSINPFTGEGSLSGQYQGQPILTDCIQQSKWDGYQVRCQVFVDGRLATNLTF